MKKPISFALIAVGVILIGYGANASDSPGSSISRLFAGSPTDTTLWLLIGGFIAFVAGASGLLRGTKSR